MQAMDILIIIGIPIGVTIVCWLIWLMLSFIVSKSKDSKWIKEKMMENIEATHKLLEDLPYGSQSSGKAATTENIEFENMDFFDKQFQTVVDQLLSNEELLVCTFIDSLPGDCSFDYTNKKFNKYIKNRSDAAAVRCKNARSEILRILREELSQCKEMRVVIPENVKKEAFGFSSMRAALIKYIINLSYVRPRLDEQRVRFNLLVSGY